MLGNFQLDIDRFVKKAGGNVDLVVRKIAFDVFKRVVQKSPVDTGRFKSNWQVAVGSIPTGVLDLGKDITHGADGKEHARGAGGQRSAAAGSASLGRVTTVTLNMRAGQTVYLVNNLDYARALEYGHSKQAPAGMVRITLTEFPGVVQRAANEVNQ